MNSKYTDWTDYFNAVPSSTYINKGCMKSLFKTFDATVSENEALNQVEKHSETVFLARLSLRSGLNLFHHFIQVGGTVYSDDKEAGFFLGLNKSTTAKMTPDIDVLFETPHADAYRVAKKVDILKCKTLADITNLKESSTVSYRARNFIPIPPFLTQTVVSVISVNKGQAENLLEVISAMKYFDTTYSEDKEYKEKLEVVYEPLLAWLCVFWSYENRKSIMRKGRFSIFVKENRIKYFDPSCRFKY